MAEGKGAYMELTKELLLKILQEQEGEFTIYIDLTKDKVHQDGGE